MRLPELPEPQTKEQSVIFAKIYADAIAGLSQLEQLKTYRLSLSEKEAPDWFIRMLDIEIDFILYRIDYLSDYNGAGNPLSYAVDTLQYIRVVMDMMRNFLRPERMHWISIKRADEWLSKIDE